MIIIYNLSKVNPAIVAQIHASPKFSKWFSEKPDQMLRLDGSTKVIKGNKLGYRTAILYLSPAKLSGQQFCPNAKLAGCIDACLNTAGRGMMTGVQMSRLRKSLFWQQYQAEAIALIKHEIELAEKQAKREKWTLLVRLNGTSDIRFENYEIIQAFPNVQFYDYTKLANRKNIPTNYDLTFSYSGLKSFQPIVDQAIKNKQRIAAVFRNKSTVQNMLADNASFLGLTVVDGDDTDIRHLDPIASVVALYAKGKAKADTSGFVVN
jgi:hypothetical protein